MEDYSSNEKVKPEKQRRNTRNVLLSAQMGDRASVVLICIITSRYNEVK